MQMSTMMIYACGVKFLNLDANDYDNYIDMHVAGNISECYIGCK